MAMVVPLKPPKAPQIVARGEQKHVPIVPPKEPPRPPRKIA